MTIQIEPMRITDHESAIALWQSADGVRLTDADTRDRIARYLERNPDMSFVARDEMCLVGTVLAGHDGRRGYLHHLAVAPSHRRQGVGRSLVARSLDALAAAGMTKCHLFILPGNAAGREFWHRVGWQLRSDLNVMSRDLP